MPFKHGNFLNLLFPDRVIPLLTHAIMSSIRVLVVQEQGKGNNGD